MKKKPIHIKQISNLLCTFLSEYNCWWYEWYSLTIEFNLYEEETSSKWNTI